MQVSRFAEWPEEWGIIFAVWAYGGKFSGKVKLNKYLSILQREGFPIMNRFKNFELGPYDEGIDTQSDRLRIYGLLGIEKVPTEKGTDMYLYEITDRGRELVQKDIIPLVEALPYQRQLRGYLADTTYRFKSQRTERIVESVHRDLYLDDHNEFMKELEKTKSHLEDRFARFEDRSVDFCAGCLKTLGSLEFAIRALDHIQRFKLMDGITGKNHVFYNARILSKLANVLEGHEHFPLSSPEERREDRNFRMLELIDHRLHCIEFNSDLYDIMKPIDSQEYDFVEFLTA